MEVGIPSLVIPPLRLVGLVPRLPQVLVMVLVAWGVVSQEEKDCQGVLLEVAGEMAVEAEEDQLVVMAPADQVKLALRALLTVEHVVEGEEEFLFQNVDELITAVTMVHRQIIKRPTIVGHGFVR